MVIHGKIVVIYAQITVITAKEKKKMPELEKVIEDKLIEQLERV